MDLSNPEFDLSVFEYVNGSTTEGVYLARLVKISQ